MRGTVISDGGVLVEEGENVEEDRYVGVEEARVGDGVHEEGSKSEDDEWNAGNEVKEESIAGEEDEEEVGGVGMERDASVEEETRVGDGNREEMNDSEDDEWRPGDEEEDESSSGEEDEEEGDDGEEDRGVGEVEKDVEMLEKRRKRRIMEIFVGGLDRNAVEDDLRKVFGKVGEIVEVRMMMDKKTRKNKGFAFLRYATAAQARQAITEFRKVKVCGASAMEGNDTIYIGNIRKKWKKDVIKLLKEAGIEKIDTVTVMPEPCYPGINRGYAFLELETNRDAQLAYKKLTRKGAFGVHKKIKVSWGRAVYEPDEDDMEKHM